MATAKFSNNASGLLAVSIASGDTSVQLESGAGAEFPTVGANEYFMVAIENAIGDIEICKCTARAGDVLTVTRAQEGTVARAFTASQARVELRLTKETMERFLQHDSGTVNQNLTIPALEVSTTLQVTGATTLGAALGVTGAVTLSSTLGVTGGATFSSTVNVTGAVTLGSTLAVTGAATLAALTATSGTFSGAISCTNITLSGAVTATGKVEGSFGAFGYSAGVAGSVGASNWFRSDGNTGWLSVDYGGGIYMEDSTFIRTDGGKDFLVNGGALRVTGDISGFYSDERLKTRVAKIEHALAKVCSFEGFYYVENELARSLGFKNQERQLALSAQAVREFFPEAVKLAPFDIAVGKDGAITSKSGENYLTLDYARLVPVLIEAIKQLKQRVDDLESQL